MNVLHMWKQLQKDSMKLTAENIKKLYMKNGLLAIYKPYGIPVHGGPKIKKSLSDLFPDLEKKFELPSGSLELINRLDKNVAGVLLLSYDKYAANYLADMYRERKIEKTYLSVLVGNTKHVNGTLQGTPTEKDSRGKFLQHLNLDNKDSDEAETAFKILDNSLKTCLLCQFKSYTGYKHQVRVHASQLLNCPILGDHKYHGGPIGPQRIPVRLIQMLRMQGVVSENRKKGKIQPWQRGLIPLHLFAQKVVIPEFDDGKNLIIKAKIPKYFQTTMSNCDLLINREQQDEQEMVKKMKRDARRHPTSSLFVSKGITNTNKETSL